MEINEHEKINQADLQKRAVPQRLIVLIQYHIISI